MTEHTLSPLHAAFKAVAVEIYQLKNTVVSIEQAAGNINETKVSELIQAEIAKLTNGASEAFDTLKEIEDAITNGSTVAQAILTEIAALKADIKVIKEYIGFEQQADLTTTFQQYLTTGEQSNG